MSESKVDDRLARLFPDRGAGADHAPPVDSAPPVAIEPPAVAIEPPPPAPRGEPLVYADRPDSAADLMGAAEATRPLAEIALAADAQTPFLIGFVGPSGSGASFALRRWVENVEALAAAAGRTAGSPFLAKVVVASIDAAGVSGDPACAIASAAFAALERDRDGVNYAALADEAANAGADPLRAAAAAAERHDELVQTAGGRTRGARRGRGQARAPDRRAALRDAGLARRRFHPRQSRRDRIAAAALRSRRRRRDDQLPPPGARLRRRRAGGARRRRRARDLGLSRPGRLARRRRDRLRARLRRRPGARAAGGRWPARARVLPRAARRLARRAPGLAGRPQQGADRDRRSRAADRPLARLRFRRAALSRPAAARPRRARTPARPRGERGAAQPARRRARRAGRGRRAPRRGDDQTRRRRQTLRTRAWTGLRQRPRGAAPRRALVLRRARTVDERRRRARARRAAADRLRFRQSRRAGAQRRRAAPRSRARLARPGLRRRRGLRSGGARRASTPPKRRGGGWRSCSRSSSTSRPWRLPTAAASRRG